MRRLALVVALMSAVLASSSACTLLYLFNNDPERLPCDCNGSPCAASEVDVGKCLDGYVCINVESGDSDNPVLTAECLKAGAKKKGDECALDAECDSGLVCATRFDNCEVVPNQPLPDDFNCDLVPDEEKPKACRAACDVANQSATCNPDELCVNPGGDATPFCQTGTCTNDSDCNVGTASGFCVGEGAPPRQIGICFEACRALDCTAGQCPDCKGVDGLEDESANCVPLLDEAAAGFAISSARLMCDVPGALQQGEPCDVLGDPCAAGLFCNSNVVPSVCTKWCFFNGSPQGGNPACTAPEVCNSVDNSDLGFCL